LFNEAGIDRRVNLHPAAATPAATFEAAAATVRSIAAASLPLGVGITMHLYPLCALRWVHLKWWTPAAVHRAWLLRHIDRHGLILANAGSERGAGAHAPVTLTREPGGVRVNGQFDYVSLANAADLVFFVSPLSSPGTNKNVFCMAEVNHASVRVGASKFSGRMSLSDTCSMSFDNHLLTFGQFAIVPSEVSLGCTTQYQRAWFHLLMSEVYLARIDRLRTSWGLPYDMEALASRHELSLMRGYALRLLDEATSPARIDALARATALLKLRVSWMAQSTAAALKDLDGESASELLFLKRQPTSDDRIIAGLSRQPFVVDQWQVLARTGAHAAKAAT
jgi:hypothetical protein